MKFLYTVLFIIGCLFSNASQIPGWFFGAGKPNSAKTPLWKLYGVIAIIIWIILLVLPNFNIEEIGHPFEKDNYITNYYVNMFPNKNSSLNYRVKGEIEIITDCEDDDDGNHCIRSRLLREASFSSIKKIEFDGCDVEINKKEGCIDYNNKYWYVELTKEKVK